MLDMQLNLAMVAGETSGDLLASLLLQGMHSRFSAVNAYGIGGERMCAESFRALWDSERLAVHGYSWEVIRRLREIFSIRTQLRQQLLGDRPDVFVGVDAPDFNLGLEMDLRASGIKTVHFVCPSIWAWRANRVEKIRKAADHVLCLFPFEPELLAQHGIAATYVGHPLASVIPMQVDTAAAKVRLGLNPVQQVLALLPGSRSAEVQYLAPTFVAAAALVRAQRPDVQIVVPVVPHHWERMQQVVREAGAQEWIKLLKGQSHEVLAACDCTLIASGTATLEAALFKRPMVISYRMHPISWHLMRRKQLQSWVGLPNILCSDFVVPEILQNAATPEALAAASLDWLDAYRHAPTQIAQLQARFTALHESLLRNTSFLAADAIEKLVAH